MWCVGFGVAEEQAQRLRRRILQLEEQLASRCCRANRQDCKRLIAVVSDQQTQLLSMFLMIKDYWKWISDLACVPVKFSSRHQSWVLRIIHYFNLEWT